MTDRQKMFCDEYLICGNATDAAKRAGYSDKTAYSQGQRLLKKVESASYIREHSEKMQSDKIASAEEIREFFTSVVRSSDEKTQDRLKAGEMLAKIQGQFIEKISVEGTIPIVICGEDLLKE